MDSYTKLKFIFKIMLALRAIPPLVLLLCLIRLFHGIQTKNADLIKTRYKAHHQDKHFLFKLLKMGRIIYGPQNKMTFNSTKFH